MKNSEYNSIDFNDVADFYKENPAVVLMELDVSNDKKEDLIRDMNEYYQDVGLLCNGTEIVDIIKIDGNVLGDKGRADILLQLNKFDVAPLVRIMRCPDIKFVDDFLVNYREDYKEKSVTLDSDNLMKQAEEKQATKTDSQIQAQTEKKGRGR